MGLIKQGKLSVMRCILVLILLCTWGQQQLNMTTVFGIIVQWAVLMESYPKKRRGIVSFGLSQFFDDREEQWFYCIVPASLECRLIGQLWLIRSWWASVSRPPLTVPIALGLLSLPVMCRLHGSFPKQIFH